MDPVLFLRPSAATSGQANGTADTGGSPNQGLPGPPAAFLSVFRNNPHPPGTRFDVSGSDAAKDPDGLKQEMSESYWHEYGHVFGMAETPETHIGPDAGLQRATSAGDDTVRGADHCLVLVTAPELPSTAVMAEGRTTLEETQGAYLQNMPAEDTEWFPAEATPVVLSATVMTETEMRETPPAQQEALNVVHLREYRQVQERTGMWPNDAPSSGADTTGQDLSLIATVAPRIVAPGEEQAADRSTVTVPSTERIPTHYAVLVREARQTPSKTAPEPPSSGTDPETTADHAPVVSQEKPRGLSMNWPEMQVGIWRSEAEAETTGRPLGEGRTAAGVTDSGLAGNMGTESRTATPDRQTTHNSHVAVLSLEQVLGDKRASAIPATEKPSSPDQNPTNGTTRTRPDVTGGLVSGIFESGSAVAGGRTRISAAEDVEAEPSVGAGHLTSQCTTSDPKVAAPAVERSSGIPHNLPTGLGHRLAETAAQFLDRPLELTLSPEELGRVRMSFTTQDGALTMLLQADRQETLELLRRNIDQLAQDFRNLGFQDLTFHFGQGQDQHSSPSVMNDQDRTDTRSEDTEFIATALTNDPTSPLAGDGGLDLRI